MQTFQYTVRKPDGEIIRSQMEAPGQTEVIAELTKQGLVVIEVRKSRDLRASKNALGQRRKHSSKKLPAREVGIFCRQFATLYSAGIPIVQSLAAIGEQAEHHTLAVALQSVVLSLEAGENLALAMKRHPMAFPTLLVNMVAAGELTGRLDNTLMRAAAYFERVHEIEQKVKGALTYPAVIVVVAIVVTWFLLVTVIPNFAELFDNFDMELPFLTRWMMGLSAFVRATSLYFILALILFSLLFIRWSRTPKGRFRLHGWLLKLPIVGKMLTMNAISRFCRTLASLSRSGVNMVTGLQLVERNVGNMLYAQAVNDAAAAVSRGGRLTPPLLESKLFPPLVVRMIQVGEDTGQLDDMLDQVADFYDRDIANMADQMSKLIEPFVIIALAAGVGVIVLSVALPMLNMMNAVQI